ncbi:hypothetical protein VIBNIFTn2_120080 [Vibrio nigripulchritudo FTn2]|uniref:hypothetical protein n=1 Tax=Vibrio nigripulchritudo TaxID=28173 RepID=UPI0003B22C2D|nr:hypothetical protein [Vibrio nigripulchritudo]CCN40098.1 hypothetical protein VIBNIFTn2_120080 [Vibrio nigripulchritudo FTn2]
MTSKQMSVEDLEVIASFVVFITIIFMLLLVCQITAILTDSEIDTQEYKELESGFMNCRTHESVAKAMKDGVITESEFDSIKKHGPGKGKALLLKIPEPDCSHDSSLNMVTRDLYQ